VQVEAGAFEFADTERFIATAESFLVRVSCRMLGAIGGAHEQAQTPYVWGRYDLLLLPPSFPYGGMENPMLTFVTPTLLAGDRSLANVVAHEIAHRCVWAGVVFGIGALIGGGAAGRATW
jgi:leukotriene-A4 hydrolase